MHLSRKIILVSAGLAIFGIAGAVLLYSGYRRSGLPDTDTPPELLSAVPPGAPTLIYIDLTAIRASAFYQQRPDHGPIALPDKDYADFVRSTGFDFEKDLDRVVMVSWPSPSVSGVVSGGDQKKTIVVADGRFDHAKIRDYAMQKGKLDYQDGHDVFLFHTEDRKSWNALTFLGDHRIGMVEGSSIAPLLERHGDGSAADPTRERAARVVGAAVFLVSRVPTIPDNFASGGVQSGQIAKLARSIQWITVAARPEGDDLRVSLEGECATNTDALQVKSALEFLRLFARSALESPKTRQSMAPVTYGVLENLLKNAELEQKDQRVRILIELTPDMLKPSGQQKTQ